MDELKLQFTNDGVPQEFAVWGSADGGHSWRAVFGTDLNTSYSQAVPINGDFSHLKIEFMTPGDPLFAQSAV